MLLTGEQVAQYLITPKNLHKINQSGVDLSVCKVERITGGVVVGLEKTRVLPENYIEIEPLELEDGKYFWHLTQGAYALTLNEGVSIPPNATGFITSRSSIYRGGAKIISPMWDPGFKTQQMGTTLFVAAPIYIEVNARVGQFFMISNPVPTTLYNGQFQNITNY